MPGLRRRPASQTAGAVSRCRRRVAGDHHSGRCRFLSMGTGCLHARAQKPVELFPDEVIALARDRREAILVENVELPVSPRNQLFVLQPLHHTSDAGAGPAWSTRASTDPDRSRPNRLSESELFLPHRHHC